MQPIDDWVTNRRLGLLFEGKIGRGKLLVCSMDLGADDPVTRQMRHSLLDYIAGDRFLPAVELSPEQIRGLTADQKTEP